MVTPYFLFYPPFNGLVPILHQFVQHVRFAFPQTVNVTNAHFPVIDLDDVMFHRNPPTKRSAASKVSWTVMNPSSRSAMYLPSNL